MANQQGKAAKGKNAKGKNALIFHDVFLNSIKNNGRLYELGLAMQVNLRTGNLLKDAELGLPMFLKGKLKLLPSKIKGTDEIKKIFAAAKQMEAE
jgi:heterodisulfide reductase subunit C